MEFSVRDVAELLNGKIEGDATKSISKFGKIQDADPSSISFLSNPKYENYIYSTNAAVVIVRKDFIPARELKTTLIRVDDPYLSFSVLLDEYHRMTSFQKEGIEEPCYIGKNSVTGKNIYRGAFSYIGEHVIIGDHVKIYPHVYIGDNAEIGDYTIVRSGVKIYENVKIGKHCVIHSGSVIGSDGFGFAPMEDGSYKTIPQVGNVIIEDHVDIGANTVIDCATFDSTIIKKGVKLDNLIQIAHNVEIGENTVIAALTGISGSSKIGKNCVIGGQTGMVGHAELGDKIKVGAQTGITKSYLKQGTILLGAPALERDKFVKLFVIYKKLPDLLERIKNLEKKILSSPES